MLVYGKYECFVMSCRCCVFVSCVHPVAVLNSASFMTCSLLMLVEDEKGGCSCLFITSLLFLICLLFSLKI